MQFRRIIKPKILFIDILKKTFKLKSFCITLTITRYLVIGVIAAFVSNVSATPKVIYGKSATTIVSTKYNQHNQHNQHNQYNQSGLFQNSSTHHFMHNLNRNNHFTYRFNNRSPALILRFEQGDGSCFGVLAGPRSLGLMFIFSR